MVNKTRNIQADILAVLSDGKIKTYQQIADEIEVHRMTVYKHIKALSYRHNIETSCGGIGGGGGIRLILEENIKTNNLSEDDLLQVYDKVKHLKEYNPNLKKFVAIISSLIDKRRNFSE